MLALPVSSSASGFIPSIVVMFLCCVFMTITGLLYLEATLWMKDKAHINTLSALLLNKFWRGVCWITFLFICYASLVAYISGGGKEIVFVLTEMIGVDSTLVTGLLVFTLVFGLILFLGHRSVERVNSLFFISMIIAYVLLVAISNSQVDLTLLKRQVWGKHLLFIIPLMLTTFSFPGIVPTIVPYLEKNKNAVRASLLAGTSITFLVYLLWLFLVFGSVPHEGEHGLKEAFACDLPATECLHYALDNPFLSSIAQFFAFFALATSFLGISLSLYDFLRDSMESKIQAISKPLQRLLLCLLILAPSFFFAVRFERAFITALELSGGVGDALLSGIIPALMVWKGRYRSSYSQPGAYRVMGGKFLLAAVIVFAFSIFLCEVIRRIITLP